MMGQCKHNTDGLCEADNTWCSESPWCGGSEAWALNIWGDWQVNQYAGKDLFS